MVWVLIYLPLTLSLFLLAIVLLIISVISTFKNFKDTKFKSFFPLFFSILLLFILIVRPFFPLFQTIEFSINFDEREEVANQIVLKIDDKLLFFKVRGVLDNFSGYVYSPDGIVPTNEDVQADIVELRKMDANWFYVSCT